MTELHFKGEEFVDNPPSVWRRDNNMTQRRTLPGTHMKALHHVAAPFQLLGLEGPNSE